MLKKLLKELDKGVERVKQSALGAEAKSKAEDLARAAGGGVAEAARFLKERSEAVKPKADALGQAAREGFEKKTRFESEPEFGDAGEFETGERPFGAEAARETEPAVAGKGATAARAAGEGVGSAVKFLKERLDAARPGLERAAEALAQSAEDLARAAREGYEERSREAELREAIKKDRGDLADRKEFAQTVEATPVVVGEPAAAVVADAGVIRTETVFKEVSREELDSFGRPASSATESLSELALRGLKKSEGEGVGVEVGSGTEPRSTQAQERPASAPASAGADPIGAGAETLDEDPVERHRRNGAL